MLAGIADTLTRRYGFEHQEEHVPEFRSVSCTHLSPTAEAAPSPRQELHLRILSASHSSTLDYRKQVKLRKDSKTKRSTFSL